MLQKFQKSVTFIYISQNNPGIGNLSGSLDRYRIYSLGIRFSPLNNSKLDYPALRLVFFLLQNIRARSPRPYVVQNNSASLNCPIFWALAASPQLRGVGKILPGLAKFLGLKQLRIYCIVSKSVSSNI